MSSHHCNDSNDDDEDDDDEDEDESLQSMSIHPYDEHQMMMSHQQNQHNTDSNIDCRDDEAIDPRILNDSCIPVAPTATKTIVNVDVCVRSCIAESGEYIRSHLHEYLREERALLVDEFLDFSSCCSELSRMIEHARIFTPDTESCVPFWEAKLLIHVYMLNNDGVGEEVADDEGDIVACQTYTLPAREFEGLWESLVFEDSIQSRLLNYANTTMLFSDCQVNCNLVSWNRIVLLYGEPGTGKTSLCKAVAQKLAIRLAHRYEHSCLVEINAHSLFSKWFSESGKLVLKLFQRLHDLIDDKHSLVFVLIDEVESLASARQAALSGAEPSDSIRVVNALLTQLDQLKSKPNVIVFTTSNICQAIDLAFVDRADIKLHIGLPGVKARTLIIRSCIDELIRVGVVERPLQGAAFNDIKGEDIEYESTQDEHFKLVSTELAQLSDGLSGRGLRRLPFQAHSLFVNESLTSRVSFLSFVSAMRSAIAHELSNSRQAQLSEPS